MWVLRLVIWAALWFAGSTTVEHIHGGEIPFRTWIALIVFFTFLNIFDLIWDMAVGAPNPRRRRG